MVSSAYENAVEVCQHRHKLRSRHRVSAVLRPSQPRDDVLDGLRDVIPSVLHQENVDACVGALKRTVAESDFHSVRADEDKVRSARRLAAGVAAHHHPVHLEQEVRPVAVQSVAEVNRRCRPVNRFDVRQLVHPEHHEARLIVPHRVRDLRLRNVRHRPAVQGFRHLAVHLVAFTGGTDAGAKTFKATFGIRQAQPEITVGAPVALLVLDEHLALAVLLAFTSRHRPADVARAFLAVAAVEANRALLALRSGISRLADAFAADGMAGADGSFARAVAGHAGFDVIRWTVDGSVEIRQTLLAVDSGREFRATESSSKIKLNHRAFDSTYFMQTPPPIIFPRMFTLRFLLSMSGL